MFLSSDTPFSVGGYYKSTHHTINYISNARCSLELKKYTLFILYSDATIDRCHCPFALHCPSAPKERLPCPCCTHFYSIYVHSWIIYMVCSIYQKKNLFLFSRSVEIILPRRQRRLSRTLDLLAGCSVWRKNGIMFSTSAELMTYL